MHRRHASQVSSIAGALFAGLMVAGAAHAADKPKPASSCVACHTDAEKLKLESAKVPAAPASALQAGKG